jgi:hypothetical protein
VKDRQAWLRYLEYLDGAMIESFAVGWNGSHRSLPEWLLQMNLAETAQKRGKLVVLVAQGSQPDTARQKFAFASYLLVNEGYAFFRYADADGYRRIWLYENYEIDLGKPLGSRYLHGFVWRRDYEKGYVIVDPLQRTATIEVNTK